MMGDMNEDIMTQIQKLFSKHLKEEIKVIQGELIGMVIWTVSTLVDPILQQ